MDLRLLSLANPVIPGKCFQEANLRFFILFYFIFKELNIFTIFTLRLKYIQSYVQEY